MDPTMSSLVVAQSIIAPLSALLTFFLKKYIDSLPKNLLPLISSVSGLLLMLLAKFSIMPDLTPADVAMGGVISGGAGVGTREIINRLVTGTKVS